MVLAFRSDKLNSGLCHLCRCSLPWLSEWHYLKTTRRCKAFTKWFRALISEQSINDGTRFLLFMKFERFTQSLCYTELWLCNIDNIGSTYHLYKRQGYLVNVISNKDGHYSSNTRCFYSSNKSYDHIPGFTYVSFPTWLPVVPESLPAGTWNWNS